MKLDIELKQCNKQFQEYKMANLQIANDNLNKVIDKQDKAINNHVNREALKNKIKTIKDNKIDINKLNTQFNCFNNKANEMQEFLKDNKEFDIDLCLK